MLNAYLIILISLLLASSRLGDMKGYRKIFLAGFILFTIGSALCGLAPGIDVLILSRMLQAVGGAIIAALEVALVILVATVALGPELAQVSTHTLPPPRSWPVHLTLHFSSLCAPRCWGYY